MKTLFILLLMTSCFAIPDSLPVAQNLSAKKQKQKIVHLQKKLELAEKEREKAGEEVEKLSDQVQKAKLALIRRQLDDFEKQMHQKSEQLLQVEASTLFGVERESLHEMIQNSSPLSFEAQEELNRILRIITELSDTVRR